MTTYPGLPGPIVCDRLSREETPRALRPGHGVPIEGMSTFPVRAFAVAG